MTTPLILQIQQVAMDSKSSVTDALRKAKIICVKLGLNWVDLELNGYIGKKFEELPEYRKLHGIPEAFNRYQGWQPIIFRSPEQEKNWSFAPIKMTIAAIEHSLRDSISIGALYLPYPPEVRPELRKLTNVNWINDFRI